MAAIGADTPPGLAQRYGKLRTMKKLDQSQRYALQLISFGLVVCTTIYVLSGPMHLDEYLRHLTGILALVEAVALVTMTALLMLRGSKRR